MKSLWFKELLFSLLAGGVTYYFAITGQWTSADILWSLWISSLLIGYLTLMLGAIGQLRFGLWGSPVQSVSSRQGEPSQKVGLAAFLILLGMAIFQIAFFTVHFLGFHYGHSLFLNEFFPIISAETLDHWRVDPLDWLMALVIHGMQNYWPVVLVSAVMQHAMLVAALRDDRQAMMAPYKTVVKMHITIILLGFLAAFGVKEPILLILLMFYFLPLVSWVKAARASLDADQQAKV